MTTAALRYAASQQTRALDELKRFLRFPSVSTLPDRRADVRAAAAWLAEHCRQIGLEHVEVVETEGHPLIYADWLGAPDAPTVLIYGHYDVQPVDPVEAWTSPPFEPALRGDDLVARGASDDKGQIFVHLKAVEAYLQAQGALPLNVKFLIEGEEEIGSPHLRPALVAQRARFTADVCAISDSQMLSPEKPSIVYGLRGMVYAEVAFEGPKHDLHSGSYGGAVHNPLQALCELLAGLHDAQGRVTIPGFYERVRTLDAAERTALAALPVEEADFLQETGVPALWGEAGYSILERVGARPTLEVHGLRGGFTGDGAKTVIPARASAKVSMRLVPHQKGEEIARLFEAHVLNSVPPTVRADVKILQTADPALIDPDQPAIQAAARAYEASFGARPAFTLEGGSIPVVVTLQELFDVPVVLMGFGLPDDRLHAPNEKFHLPNFHRGIACAIHFLHELGEGAA